MSRKCVFLDRDGVINQDKVDYVYRVEDFHIIEGVIPSLKLLKEAGYLLIIITNQSGIAKKIYTAEDVKQCFHFFQKQCGDLIDDHYFAPYHPQYDSESLSRKPDSLMIEKAMAKYQIESPNAWLVGDSERDIIAAQKLQIRTILVGDKESPKAKNTSKADWIAENLYFATLKILEGI